MSENSLQDINIRSASTATAASASAPSALSIIELIKDCIASKDASSQSIETMNTLLLNELEMLKAMDKNITSIMKNGKLDVGDIPELILLMKHTANLYSPKLKTLKISRGDLILFIREILVMVVSNELLDITNRELYIKLIHSGTDLLSATVELDETVRCGRFWCCK